MSKHRGAAKSRLPVINFYISVRLRMDKVCIFTCAAAARSRTYACVFSKTVHFALKLFVSWSSFSFREWWRLVGESSDLFCPTGHSRRNSGEGNKKNSLPDLIGAIDVSVPATRPNIVSTRTSLEKFLQRFREGPSCLHFDTLGSFLKSEVDIYGFLGGVWRFGGQWEIYYGTGATMQ